MLLLIDNVYRLVQAGGEVSGLLGRLPSRVGYQPTLASEIAELEERIASVAGAAITSIQAVYVPADDFTDPAVAEIFSHLDSSIVLSRDMASEGMYPAVDPLASTSSLLDPRLVGEAHYRIAQEVRKTIAHYRELQEIIALLGIEELSAADRTAVRRARHLMRFLTQPFMVTVAFTGKPGRTVELAATLAGCRAILDGEADGWAEELALHGRRSGRGARQGGAGQGGRVMKLTVTTPLAIVVEADDVAHLRAEDETGAFGILPGHADFLTALAISVVSWRDAAWRRAPRRGARRHAGSARRRRRSRSPRREAVRRRRSASPRERGARPLPPAAPRSERAARTDAQRLYLAAIRQIFRFLRPNGPRRCPALALATPRTGSGRDGGAAESCRPPERLDEAVRTATRAARTLAARGRALDRPEPGDDRRARLDDRDADAARHLRRPLARPAFRRRAFSGPWACLSPVWRSAAGLPGRGSISE